MNKEKLEEIYNENFIRIYKFFYLKVFDKFIAEDLTSETFIALAQYIKSNKDIQKPKALLYRIAGNIFNKHLRRKYSEITLDYEQLDFFQYTESYLEQTEESSNFLEFVKKFIDFLPKKQKIVMQMRLIEKKSIKTIALDLGKNENYVKTTQKRAIKNLKELLEKTKEL